MVGHKCAENQRQPFKEYGQEPQEKKQENGNKQGSIPLPSRLGSPISIKRGSLLAVTGAGCEMDCRSAYPVEQLLSLLS